MDEYEWVKPFRRRCRAKFDEPFLIYSGRCDLMRFHKGPHALERGMEVVEFNTIYEVKLSKMAELVIQQRLRERDR